MRLRYLHIPELRPLRDVSITFGHEPVLGRECTIHFIAGVNGTGKSRLLRALTEIFLSLALPNVPPFPVTIAYDLGRSLSGQDKDASRSLCTVYFRYTGQGRSSAYMVVLDHIPLHAEVEWEQFHLLPLSGDSDSILSYHRRRLLRGDEFADVKSYVPGTVLAYTSGATQEWEAIFAQPKLGSEGNSEAPLPRVELEVDERSRIERPPGWNMLKEVAYQRSQQDEKMLALPMPPAQEQQAQVEGLVPGSGLLPGKQVFPNASQSAQPLESGIFIQPHTLKLVVCAVALSQALEEFQQHYPNKSEREQFEQHIEVDMQQNRAIDGMRAIFNAVDWLWPITISLRITFSAERLQTQKKEQALLRRLYTIATRALRESELAEFSTSRTLYFDLARTLQSPIYSEFDGKDTLYALSNILGGMSTRAFDIFKQLFALQQQGILEDVVIALRKRKTDGALLYDQLSDGERVLLGRMALFHLLKGTEDTLIILDEPETHFNDVWKREVVDMIDSALRNDSSEIVLSTHSSIALTDVFHTEITLLKKNPQDGMIYATRPRSRTFGASPDDILHDIFEAPDSVGQRASEFLDVMLIATAHWEQAQGILNGDDGKRKESLAQLRQLLREEANTAISEQSDAELRDYLEKVLHSVSTYTQQRREQVNAESILDVLQERLGSGYYQFEFRRRLRALRNNSNASSH